MSVKPTSNTLPTAVVSPLISTGERRNCEKCPKEDKVEAGKFTKNTWPSNDLTRVASYNYECSVASKIIKGNVEEKEGIPDLFEEKLNTKCSVELNKIIDDKYGHKSTVAVDVLHHKKEIFQDRPNAAKKMSKMSLSQEQKDNVIASLSSTVNEQALSLQVALPKPATKQDFRIKRNLLISSQMRKNKIRKPSVGAKSSTRSDIDLSNIVANSEKLGAKSNRKRKTIYMPSEMRGFNSSEDMQTTSPKDKMQCSMFVPNLNCLTRRFSSGVVLCSFCHLPGNYLPELGDLFGPYQPTFDELLDRYKDTQQRFTSQLAVSCKDYKSEICVDKSENACYVTTGCFKCEKDSQSGFLHQSIKETDRNIKAMMPQLRMLQTIDCVLTESGKKPAAKYSRTKMLHIPGFTGKITSADGNLKTHCDANKTLLHDLQTIAFVEPTRRVPTSNLPPNSSTSNNHGSDSTSVSVIHRFDVSPVWVHAPCAIWSPDVYCIRNQLHGLTATAREAKNTTCNFCGKPGATIPQKYRKNICFHYMCCMAKGLHMDEDTLTVSAV